MGIQDIRKSIVFSKVLSRLLAYQITENEHKIVFVNSVEDTLTNKKNLKNLKKKIVKILI